MNDEQANWVKRIEALEKRNQELEAENAELKALLNKDSTNSHKPPSTDTPAARKRRRKQRRSSRKRGAQVGHKGSHRRFLPHGHTVDLLPHSCKHCDTLLHGFDARPHIHQVVDIPHFQPQITDYHLHRLQCSSCHKTTKVPLPDGVDALHYGPNVRALLATLVGAFRISRRQAAHFVNHICGVPISLGTVSNLEKRTSKALEDIHQEALTHVRVQKALHVDETPFALERGSKGYLWVANTKTVACFLVHPDRSKAALVELLGEFSGLLVSDRYGAYEAVPLARRQFCWSHLLRDFDALAEKDGKQGQLGTTLANLARLIFRILRWKRERVFQIQWEEIKRIGKKCKMVLRRCLQMCKELPRPPSWSKSLLKKEKGLWLWLEEEGLAISNNEAERALRHAVLWRKVCFGVESERGTRFAERILTVVQSLRSQGRDTFTFLRDLLTHDTHTPSLLPSPS